VTARSICSFPVARLDTANVASFRSPFVSPSRTISSSGTKPCAWKIASWFSRFWKTQTAPFMLHAPVAHFMLHATWYSGTAGARRMDNGNDAGNGNGRPPYLEAKDAERRGGKLALAACAARFEQLHEGLHTSELAHGVLRVPRAVRKDSEGSRGPLALGCRLASPQKANERRDAAGCDDYLTAQLVRALARQRGDSVLALRGGAAISHDSDERLHSTAASNGSACAIVRAQIRQCRCAVFADSVGLTYSQELHEFLDACHKAALTSPR
jgi:hypothetical protein